MLRLLLCLFLLATDSLAAYTCPEGYADDGIGCTSFSTSSLARVLAATACSNDGAFLFTIANAFQNSRVQSYAGTNGAATLWIGATCNRNGDPTSCQWDDGTPFSYHRFSPGEPNVDNGPCILMDVKTGSWLANSCIVSSIPYGCQWYPDKAAQQCSGNAVPFQGLCYNSFPVDAYAQNQCVPGTDNGRLASIHSYGQNQFVSEMGAGYSYMLLGLKKTSNSYYWLDGTPYNYSNFGYENRNIGECVSLAVVSREVPAGKWISSACSGNDLVVLCERDSVIPTPVVTLAPPECAGTSFYSGAGQLYSPGYPLGSNVLSCEYVITEDENIRASISFSDLHLDGAVIYLYDTFFDAAPFAVVSSMNKPGDSFVSDSNILKMVYVSNSTGLSTWAASYDAYPSTTTSTTTTTTSTPAPLPSICCSFVLDWSYLMSPIYASSHSTYLAQRNLMYSTAQRLFTNDSIRFGANFAGFGYVDQSGPVSFQDFYFATDMDFLTAVSDYTPVDGTPTTLCNMIGLVNAYTIPNGTSNPCLVFFSAETFSQFENCTFLTRDKFNVIIGGRLNDLSGISIYSTTTVPISSNFDQNDAQNLAQTILKYVQ